MNKSAVPPKFQHDNRVAGDGLALPTENPNMGDTEVAVQPQEYSSEQVLIQREAHGRLRLTGPLFGPGFVNVFERIIGPEEHPVYDNAVRILKERESSRQARRGGGGSAANH